MRRLFRVGGIVLASMVAACAAPSPQPAAMVDAFVPQPGETATAFENRCVGYVTDHASYGDAARCMNEAAAMRQARDARLAAEAPPPVERVPVAPPVPKVVAAAPAPCGTSITEASADGGKSVAVTIAGRITLGCDARLRHVVDEARTQYPAGQMYFVLDSPGGALRTAIDMGRVVAEDRLPVIVPPNAVCASACFLILAASHTKYVAANAHVGVHSVAQYRVGNETESSKAVTTDFARILAQLGVPSGIIGHLVETPPGQVYWLTPAELMAMGAQPLPA